jgi:glycosyltransferase involved in cell wall biosynthesis
LKIAVVSDAIFPYNIGGKEKRILELTTRLSKRHDVSIFTMNWWNGSTKKENNCTLHGVCKNTGLYNSEKRSIKQALVFSLGLIPNLMKADFDIVDCDEFPYFPIIASRIVCTLKGKPLVVTWHEVWGEYWNEYIGKLGFFGKIVEKLASKMPNKIIAVSEKTKKDLIKLGVSEKKIVVVPNGINFEEIDSVKPASKGFDLVFTGRLLKHKNAHLVVDAVEILKKDNPAISCLLVGNGPEFESLKNQIAEKNLSGNISLRNFFPEQKDILAIMKSSSLFIFPSVREGFGLTVIEANACGLPALVCVNKNNASTDLIYWGENGYVVEPEAEHIAKAIVSMQKQNWDKKAIQEKAKQFDWNKIATDVEKEYGAMK